MASIKTNKEPIFTEKRIENVQGSQDGFQASQSTIHIPTAKAKEKKARAAAEATLVNPFANMTTEDLVEAGEKFAKSHGLEHLSEQFKVAALLARIAISEDLRGFEQLDISEGDKLLLNRELDHRWRQPRELYFLVLMCSVAAAVQGMDETVTNGAQIYFPSQFGIDNNQFLRGFVNSAPYLCCAIFSCWVTDPLNYYLGRRGTIFVTAVISFITCVWQGFTRSWPHLFVARFMLGFGIGPKSTTVPVYTAECAPAPIRGALVMMWQMWTAFGIMLGLAADLALHSIPDTHNIRGLNWRLMLGSAGLPAIVVMTQVYLCPESPRWLIEKGRYGEALKSLTRLRNSPLQAARDLFYIDALLRAEVGLKNTGQHRFLDLFTVPRNRRAAVASFIVMFMQQFCGINAIAYYSSTIFKFGQTGLSDIQAFAASLGFGTINFVFALPAIWTIDTFGRRNLLLLTIPLMSLFLLLTVFSYEWIPAGRAQSATAILFIYLFSMCYSPGEGPIPFTYSAEVFPLYIRSIGMSFATAITWFFNFLNAMAFPTLFNIFSPQGVFGWFAAWNFVGIWLVFFLVPETKALSLEELDSVFSVRSRDHARYQLSQGIRLTRRFLLRQQVDLLPPLYKHENSQGGP
ncbi:hypothetical protein JB92DRAFT_63598 [Gautieria morchelliformis]|nr:hypothetical protein JB92DRAFT_63598 [Gautieria morchelliformis]